jgi:hypothetical protein
VLDIKASDNVQEKKFKITREIHATWIDCSNLTNAEWSECHRTWDAFLQKHANQGNNLKTVLKETW